MFLRRKISYMYMNIFVGTFGGLAPPPPHPNTKKLATLLASVRVYQQYRLEGEYYI